MTIAGAAVSAALQVFTDGPVSDGLTIAAAALTAAGTIFGVYRATNVPLR